MPAYSLLRNVLLVSALVGPGLALARPSPAPIEPAVDSLPLDLGRLTAGRDSFAILVQGAQIGFTLTVIDPLPTGVRLVERSSVGGFVEQTTTMELLASGSMVTMRQEGLVQGEKTLIEIDYRNGRARGSARSEAAAGPTTVSIDTTIAAGTIDENAFPGLLPALPWAVGASWSFPVFSPARNESRTSTLSVAAVDTIARPAGPTQTFRAVWTGAWQEATFWVSTATPHRVLRIAIADAPLDIVRAN